MKKHSSHNDYIYITFVIFNTSTHSSPSPQLRNSVGPAVPSARQIYWGEMYHVMIEIFRMVKAKSGRKHRCLIREQESSKYAHNVGS